MFWLLLWPCLVFQKNLHIVIYLCAFIMVRLASFEQIVGCFLKRGRLCVWSDDDDNDDLLATSHVGVLWNAYRSLAKVL